MSVPGAPVISTAPLSTDQTLEFAWSPPISDGGSAITGYRFQLDSQTPVTLSANTYGYVATGLTNNTSYVGSIEAQNANGYGPKAYFREFRPGSATPAAPATVSAVTQDASGAVVSWTAPSGSLDSDILWYVIRSVSSNQSDPELAATADGPTQTSYVFQGLNPNSSYQFDIQAVNCPGYSPANRTSAISWFTPGSAKLATRAGGATTHEYTTISVDSAGNVYQLIPLTNTATITLYNYSSAPTGGGAIGTSVYGTITAGAQGNIILVKYNSEGTVQWATKFERYQSGDLPPAIATDGSGNVYVTYANYNQSTITFYDYSSAPSGGGAVGLTSYGTLSSPSGLIMCIAKYNSSGTVAWATKVETNGLSARFPFMNTDVNGNVYFGLFVGDTTTTVSSFSSAPGSAGGSINLSTYGTYTKIGTYDAVIVKYNPSGVVQWVTALSNIANTIDLIGGFAANSSGDLYVSCSSVSSTVTVRSFTSGGGGGSITTGSWGTISTSSGSGRGAVVVKYTSSGTPVWVTRMVPVSSVAVRTTPYLSLDGNGNLYWMSCLVFAGTLTLYNYTSGGGGGSSVTTSTYGTVDAGPGQNFTPVIVKFNSSGTIQWVNSVKALNTSFLAYKSVCDSAGNFYLTAYGDGKLDVYNYTSAPSGGGAVGLTLYGYVPKAAANDVYVVKYNSSGSVVWGSSVAGSSDEIYSALDVDGLGNVWVTGTYKSNPVTVNNYTSAPVSAGDMTLTAFGTLADITGAGDNVFLAKYAV